MILFANDWRKHPTAVPHLSSKNHTFVRTAQLFRKMGVRNHMFPLALHNPELELIDPHDPNLDVETMGLIAIECKINPWYFLREVVRIPIQGGDPVPYRANRGNIALSWLFLNHITTLLIQPRQTGKTVSTDAIMTWVLNLGTYKTSVNLLTKDDGLRTKALANIKEMTEVLPPYLCMKTKKDIANTQELRIASMKNSYLGHLSSKSAKQALNVGRGFTSKITHSDEGPFTPNIAIALPAALAAGTTARDIAKKSGDVYGTILTTTAGKQDDPDGKFIYQIKEGSAIWSEHYYDAETLEDLEDIIKKAGSGNVRVNCTFNHRQLGYTDEWLKQAIKDNMLEHDPEAANRDFFNHWTAGSQTHPLSIELLTKLKNAIKEPTLTKVSKEGYSTRYYDTEENVKKIMLTKPTLLTMDSSDAGGADDITIIIGELETGRILIAGNYNELNLIKFTSWLSQWFLDYERLVAVIERRSTGAMIIDYLILIMLENNIDPFRRLFNRVVNEPTQHEALWGEIQKPLRSRPVSLYEKYKKVFGFATSGSGITSRNDLYAQSLTGAATHIGENAADSKLINQVLSLEMKNNRIDHPAGGHDDFVIAWMLFYWFITKASNLSFYGIEPLRILSETSFNEQNNSDPIESYKVRKQNRLKESINRLLYQFDKETNSYIKERLKLQLKADLSELNQYYHNLPNADALIQSLKDKKLKDKL